MPDWPVVLLVALMVVGGVGAIGVSVFNWTLGLARLFSSRRLSERWRSRLRSVKDRVLLVWVLLLLFGLGGVSFGQTIGPVLGGFVMLAGLALFVALPLFVFSRRASVRAGRGIRLAALTPLPGDVPSAEPAAPAARVAAKAPLRIDTHDAATRAKPSAGAEPYFRALAARTPRAAAAPAGARCDLLILWTFETDRSVGKVDSLIQWLDGWRAIGPILCVRGPGFERLQAADVAAWKAGDTDRVLIRSVADVDRRLAELDARPVSEGERYPVASLSCHEWKWKEAVAHLIDRSDVVLLDLRGFTAGDAGLRWEIGQLLDRRSTAEVVFLVDGSTDLTALHATLESGWSALLADSPNRDRADAVITLLKLGIRLDEAQADSELAWNVEILGVSLNPRSRNSLMRHRFMAGGREREHLLVRLCNALAARQARAG